MKDMFECTRRVANKVLASGTLLGLDNGPREESASLTSHDQTRSLVQKGVMVKPHSFCKGSEERSQNRVVRR